MSARQPFNPADGSGKSLVGAAGEVVQAYPNPLSGDPPQLLLTNIGTAVCYVRVTPQTNTVAASTADLPVMPDTQAVITINYFEPFNVRLAAGATGSTLHVMQGSGF